ncbi:MAG: hypothetical protein KatS3mg070_0741 [Meiothermus sp.]|nr:MAG: hypothetical protein KatS3mg070_0741 [Meiothermus sp.]
MKTVSHITIIKNDIKTSRSSNNKLLEFIMGVSTSALSARYIIKIINPFDFERHVSIFFNKG